MNDEVEEFLRRLAYGQVELSQDKIWHEYIYFKKRARELLEESGAHLYYNPNSFKDDF